MNCFSARLVRVTLASSSATSNWNLLFTMGSSWSRKWAALRKLQGRMLSLRTAWWRTASTLQNTSFLRTASINSRTWVTWENWNIVRKSAKDSTMFLFRCTTLIRQLMKIKSSRKPRGFRNSVLWIVFSRTRKPARLWKNSMLPKLHSLYLLYPMTMGVRRSTSGNTPVLIHQSYRRPQEKTTTRTHEGKFLCQFCTISLQKQAIFGDMWQ